MINPEPGFMLMDRMHSRVYKITDVDRSKYHRDELPWHAFNLFGETYDGKYRLDDLNASGMSDLDIYDDNSQYPDRWVILEPLQVLEYAKHVTEVALSYDGPTEVAKGIQRQLCLQAIWLLQWFAED